MAERREDPGLLLALLDHSPGLVMLVDDQAVVRWINRPASELFGWEPAELIGRSVLEFLDPDWDPEAFESIGTAMGAGGLRLPMLFRALRRDGSTVIVEVTANTQMQHPDLHGMVVYVRQWDERYLLDQALEAMAASRPLDETLSLLVRIAEAETLEADAAILHDRQGDRFAGVVASSGLPAALAGPTAASSPQVQEAWCGLLEGGEGHVHPVSALPAELRTPAEDAGYRTLWLWSAAPSGVTGSDAVVVAWRREDHLDVDQTRRQAMARLARVAGLVVERVRSEAATAHAAAHDALTGLANRDRFFVVVDEALASGESVGVVYLDLDGFKPINDALGHGAGDRVLAEVAGALRAGLPAVATVARLGGDEFALVCRGVDADELVELAEAGVALCRQPVPGRPGESMAVGASAGVALAPAGATDVSSDVLVDAADRALYEAKRSGGGVVHTGELPTPAG